MGESLWRPIYISHWEYSINALQGLLSSEMGGNRGNTRGNAGRGGNGYSQGYGGYGQQSGGRNDWSQHSGNNNTNSAYGGHSGNFFQGSSRNRNWNTPAGGASGVMNAIAEIITRQFEAAEKQQALTVMHQMFNGQAATGLRLRQR